MYATVITDALTQIQTLLTASAATYLAAVNNYNILLGEKIKDFKFPSTYIEPVSDSIIDYTVNQQQTSFEIIITVTVKGYNSQTILTDLIKLVGDVYDVLMLPANRVLSDTCDLETVSRTNWGLVPMDKQILRWCEMTVLVNTTHVVS